MFEEFDHFFQESKPVKNYKVPDYLDPVDDFQYDTVYHGSHINPKKGNKYTNAPDNILFVSPDIGEVIPHCVDHNIFHDKAPIGFSVSDIDYASVYIKNADPDDLPTTFSIKVFCRGEEREDKIVTIHPGNVGSIYEIDISDYKDHIYKVKGTDENPVYCIAGYDKIKFSRKIRHRVDKIYAHYYSYPDEEFNEGKIERVNDKGKEVPEKCDKCGSDIRIFLHGEPVWLCSNKKCKKYFGTVPCNIQESKLPTTKRNKLEDSDFGIPEKRQYPLHDKEHVEAAVRMFPHAPFKDRKKLAHRILSKAKEYGMDTSGWESLKIYKE